MKLFGYTIIPTKQLDLLKKSLRQEINRVADWQRTNPDYYLIELDEQYYRWKVLMCRGRFNQREYALIKSFHYYPDTEDDKAYALRCAEELLDKLEEKI